MTLVSDIATDYYQLLSLDLQLQIARRHIESQTESVRLTRLRVETDRYPGGHLQAQQVLDSANARIPELERQAGRYERRHQPAVWATIRKPCRAGPRSPNSISRRKCRPGSRQLCSSAGRISARPRRC